MNSRVSLVPAPRFVGTAVEPTMSAPNVIRSQSSGIHRGRQRGTASGRAQRRPQLARISPRLFSFPRLDARVE